MIRAHAYRRESDRAPGHEIHFNGAAKWTLGPMPYVDYINNPKYVDLYQVLVHEIGHVLGLGHTDKTNHPGSVMRPYLDPKLGETAYNPAAKLDISDIKQVQDLYGAKENYASDLRCKHETIDTIYKSVEGIRYAFKGDLYWMMRINGTKRRIADSWYGLPSDIDAAFVHFTNKKTYFFKGPLYWRYSGFVMDGNYPRFIGRGFSGVPDNIDVAHMFNTEKDRAMGYVYYFKGDTYYLYDSRQKKVVKQDKIRSLRRSLPNNLEAAFDWATPSQTYFYKCGQFYNFGEEKTEPVCTLKEQCEPGHSYCRNAVVCDDRHALTDVPLNFN